MEYQKQPEILVCLCEEAAVHRNVGALYAEKDNYTFYIYIYTVYVRM